MKSLLPLLAGCGAFDQDPTLRPFESCEDMGDYMEHMALREARGAHVHQFPAVLMGCSDKSAGSDIADESATEYSTTNTQEEGVDEADFVETDGTWLYSLGGGHLVISRAWPIEEAAQASSVQISGRAQGIYYYDDTVVVLSDVSWERTHARSGASFDSDRESAGLVTVVDVADREGPRVVRETVVTGELRDSRRIDDRLYVVAYLDVDLPGTWDATLAEIKRAIRRADPDDWLPRQQDNAWDGSGWTTREGRVADCTDVYASNRETGTLFTHVMSLDLSDPTGALSGQGVVGQADNIYVSSGAIYVAYNEVDEGPFRSLDESLDTILHKFDVTGAANRPKYVDTVQIPGVLPDQFGLSEWRGVLRMATTDQRVWTTSVWTLEERDGKFERLDHLDGLAPGETLTAARFVGRVGYLVTVDQEYAQRTFADPLFTVDLQDPSHVEDVGKIELSGWSDYLHPMGDDHLIAVGVEGEESIDVAISLFDVSDLREPALVDREILDAGSSEAQWDHHAFNWFESQEALALPILSRDGRSLLELLRITEADVSRIGSVEQQAGEEWACTRVRRSVFMEDEVWAVSEGGLTAAALATPEVVDKTVEFEGIGPCQGDAW